jgi:hypothetical protein
LNPSAVKQSCPSLGRRAHDAAPPSHPASPAVRSNHRGLAHAGPGLRRTRITCILLQVQLLEEDAVSLLGICNNLLIGARILCLVSPLDTKSSELQLLLSMPGPLRPVGEGMLSIVTTGLRTPGARDPGADILHLVRIRWPGRFRRGLRRVRSASGGGSMPPPDPPSPSWPSPWSSVTARRKALVSVSSSCAAVFS